MLHIQESVFTLLYYVKINLHGHEFYWKVACQMQNANIIIRNYWNDETFSAKDG